MDRLLSQRLQREMSESQRSNTTERLAPAVCPAPTFCIMQISGPIERNAVLRRIERHPSVPHLFGQIVLDVVFALEEPIIERDTLRPTFRPDIAKTVRTAQLEWNEMVQFTDLIAVGIDARLLNLVPAICYVLHGLAALTVTYGAGPPPGIAQHLDRDRGIDASWGTPGIRYGVAVLHAHRTGGNFRLFPVREVFGAASDIL